ncbi:MAG: hypothetical protein K8T25_00915 [Planctomycetia bacterium]|nr:hypothetical protein [Planctomycetia bacterium]
MDSYGQVLLVISAVVIICGLVGLWIISRYAPKGTVLAISAAMYVASWGIDTNHVRELVLICGLMRLLGFVGGILGIFDLVRKRPSPNAIVVAEAVDAEAIEAEGVNRTPNDNPYSP